MPASRSRNLSYAIFLFAFAAIGTAATALVRIRSGFAYPRFFDVFRAAFFLEHGLFIAALLALLLFLGARSWIPHVVEAACYFVFHLWFVWILIWNFVHRFYGIEVSFATVFDLIRHWQGVAEVGLSGREFGAILAIAAVLAIGLTILSLKLRRAVDLRSQRHWLITLSIAFLAVHLPVRAFCVYQINRNQAAVLAYDDCVAFALRSESLVPGLRSVRLAIPDLSSPERTAAYFRTIKELPLPKLPYRPNILWLNVESLRSDAIEPTVMPRLWQMRDQFQIRLQHDHWSGGNATQFGIVSMLTGLSGHQLANFQKYRVKAPLLKLLSGNGYRLVGGKSSYFAFNELRELLPDDMELPDIPRGSPAKEDVLTIDHYLKDRQSRSAVPTFDFIPFDATHWPYWFPPDAAKFQPASPTRISQHFILSANDLIEARNRYRNACGFIDQQIGRVLDDLSARDNLKNTIVIVLGDHGEEFQERGQLTHAAVNNDFQGQTLLWIHFPNLPPQELEVQGPTTHLDIVPTLLSALGLKEDVLYTQGYSLLASPPHREILALCENGFRIPLYRALVTKDFISRWAYRPGKYLFSGLQRRDGGTVTGDEWLKEVQAHLKEAAEMYEVLPDTSAPPRRFGEN